MAAIGLLVLLFLVAGARFEDEVSRYDINCNTDDIYKLKNVTVCLYKTDVITEWSSYTLKTSSKYNNSNGCRVFTNYYLPTVGGVAVDMDYLYFYEKWDKGLLTPYEDFDTSEQVAALCDYSNVSPFHPSLTPFWKKVEDYVTQHFEGLDVYTGTAWSPDLPTNYLGEYYKNDVQNLIVSIPHFVWKWVIDDQNRKAAVFVGVNDYETICPSGDKIIKFCSKNLCPAFGNPQYYSLDPIYCCNPIEFFQNLDEKSRPFKEWKNYTLLDLPGLGLEERKKRVTETIADKHHPFCFSDLIPPP